MPLVSLELFVLLGPLMPPMFPVEQPANVITARRIEKFFIAYTPLKVY
jgi:hypothetical protein